MVKWALEPNLSDLGVLVLNHHVCFSEQGDALGDQEELLDSRTGRHALEFLMVGDFLSHSH